VTNFVAKRAARYPRRGQIGFQRQFDCVTE
jgi:hypothetical protein